MKKIKVTFICTGNICRSPTAQGLIDHNAKKLGIEKFIIADSAGTHSWHTGQPPDERSQAAAVKKEIDISSIRAKKISENYLNKFNYILAMNHEHLTEISKISKKFNCFLLLNFSKNYYQQEVPDPYFGNESDFHQTLRIIEDGIDGFLKYILKTYF